MKETNKELKPIVKHKHTGLKIAVCAILSAVTITGSTIGAAKIKNSKYSSNESIYKLTQTFDADNSYIVDDGEYTLLQNNGNDPIYVYLDDSLTEEYNNYSKEALEYVFGVVGKINSHYKYKIVDKNEYDKHFLKSRIMFTSNDTINYTVDNTVNGYHHGTPSILSQIDNKKINKESTIYLTPQDKLQGLEPVRKDTAIHELLHAFGFEDTYTLGDKKQKDIMTKSSVIRPSLSHKLPILTPNDLKCLISMYAENPEDQNEIAKYKKMLKDYEKKYYDNFAKACLNRNKNYSELECENFKFIAQTSYTDLDHNTNFYNYEIINDNNQYSFKIFDGNNKLIYSTSGESISSNNIVILKDLVLRNGFTPNSTQEEQIINLAFMSNNGKACLYDLTTNFDVIGQIYNLENELNV